MTTRTGRSVTGMVNYEEHSRWLSRRRSALSAIQFTAKWTAIAVWFDLTSRLIGSPMDFLLAMSSWTAWLDGFTNVTCR